MGLEQNHDVDSGRMSFVRETVAAMALVALTSCAHLNSGKKDDVLASCGKIKVEPITKCVEDEGKLAMTQAFVVAQLRRAAGDHVSADCKVVVKVYREGKCVTASPAN